ncbi:MAG: hypothetical protein LQ342_000920 [Letrouitia transgressa]|nr:MAG: hypothetical protein LQ342_000920 [Letrouitia transgressa]
MPLFQFLRERFGRIQRTQPPQRPQLSTPRNSRFVQPRSSSLREVKSRLDRKSISPSARTSQWLKLQSPEIKIPKALAAKSSKITKSTKSSNPVTQPRKKTKARTSFWSRVLSTFRPGQVENDTVENLEGDTLVTEGPPPSSPGFGNDTTLVDEITDVEAATPFFIKPENEDTYYVPTEEDLEIMENWSEAEVWLFHKINKRGFEPLLPEIWAREFRTLPKNLFSEDDSKVFIKTYKGNEYNGKLSPHPLSLSLSTNTFGVTPASRALQSLFNLPGRVRDRVNRDLSPEEPLRRELLAYHKWTLKDADLAHTPHIPVVAIGTAAEHETVASVVGRVTDQLHELGRQYNKLFYSHTDEDGVQHLKRELPTLYGIVITYTVVSFVTYDAHFPGKQVQSMGTYDFSQTGGTVWLGLAVSIYLIKARNYLIELEEAGFYGHKVVYDSDPDA